MYQKLLKELTAHCVNSNVTIRGRRKVYCKVHRISGEAVLLWNLSLLTSLIQTNYFCPPSLFILKKKKIKKMIIYLEMPQGKEMCVYVMCIQLRHQLECLCPLIDSSSVFQLSATGDSGRQQRDFKWFLHPYGHSELNIQLMASHRPALVCSSI